MNVKKNPISRLKLNIVLFILIGIFSLNCYLIPQMEKSQNSNLFTQKSIELKLSSSSYSLDWIDIWGGSEPDYGFGGISIDNLGYIYITGSTYSYGAGRWDTYIIKYNSSGGRIWTRFWGGSNDEHAHDITLDSLGNIYITGELKEIAGHPSDIFLLKYDSDGHYQWSSTWGPSQWNDGYGVVVNESGDIYVTGRTGGDFALLKYNSSGNFVWAKTNPSLSTGRDIAISESGGLYIIGAQPGGQDAFISKYDRNCSLVWNRQWGGSEGDWASCIAVNKSGDVYFTGSTYSYGLGLKDVIIVNYDSSGTMKWNKTWGTSRDETGYGITLDDKGDIYLTGEVNTKSRKTDTFITKFNSDGNLIWDDKWGYYEYEGGNRIALDMNGSIYITGSRSNYGGEQQDVFLIKYISEDDTESSEEIIILGSSIISLLWFLIIIISGIVLYLIKRRKVRFS